MVETFVVASVDCRPFASWNSTMVKCHCSFMLAILNEIQSEQIKYHITRYHTPTLIFDSADDYQQRVSQMVVLCVRNSNLKDGEQHVIGRFSAKIGDISTGTSSESDGRRH